MKKPEFSESRASRFIREIEARVAKTSIHGVEPPSLEQHGSNHVMIEPLILDHQRVADILLSTMAKLADILKVVLIVKDVPETDQKFYSSKGFQLSGDNMIYHPS